MDTLELNNVIALPTDCCKRYRGIAFDGCFFYLTMPEECRIYKFNRNFAPAGYFEVGKQYSAICYDNTENCFWACADKHVASVFRLDCNLVEIDCVQIQDCASVCSAIVGISYNCEQNTLLIAFITSVIEISKDGCCIRVLQKICSGTFTGVLSIAPYYVTVCRCGQTQELAFYSCEGCLIKSCCLPYVYAAEDILFYPCAKSDQSMLRLMILATKHCCYPRLLCCNVDACGITLCCCNYEVCCDPCKNDRTDQCVCDLIESIALVETALSHILNAEGEKLQKAVELAEDTCELLEVNRSVHRTIMNITQLENILYAKLDVLSDLSKNPCHDKSHCCNDAWQ